MFNLNILSKIENISLCMSLLISSTSLLADENIDTTSIPDNPEPIQYDVPIAFVNAFPVNTPMPIIRVYKDYQAWHGRDVPTLQELGLIPGTDWFTHPVSECANGIPNDTNVVLFTSNSVGSSVSASAQNSPECQASLSDFLASGGVLIVDMADNLSNGGYFAPGASGTPSFILGSPQNATLTTEAIGHPISNAYIPWDDNNIDMGTSSYVAHGNLAQGIILPVDATTLMSVNFNGIEQPVLAEYCLGSGRVILDTLSKEYYGHKPVGNGSSNFMLNLFSYALSSDSACNQSPTANANGPYLLAVGATVMFDGSASTDPDGDLLTETWSAAGGTIIGNEYTAGSTPGIYEVTLIINDGNGGTDTAYSTVVVYDPSGGFVTGGGWIDSPSGAYVPNPELVGRANFGFVSKYKKGAKIPTGQTEFNFHIANLNFHSENYEWLVVNQNGENAQYKGVGTINEMGSYGFMLWAGDNGSVDDTFRIKVWDRDNGEIIYDNGVDQLIGGGQVVIHQGKK